ncbi:MAG: pyridoxal-5-phosphate-dependent protein subunit beta [Candidatus Heimdallarchaeota archaeon]|nr:pyridoxal-5-phosphate-dependent protein subunit beta [Candidatus Heimdallarchaeota archaeon]MBY8995960.1 pyridoxal-5-phosphate-dependent protein subunit beta [Candidatus Heimdallarchaeota archaeon]
MLIDLTVNEEVLKQVIKRARKQNIIIPTFEQQRNPKAIPKEILKELSSLSLWEVHPRNLFRITWKNEPVEKGGGFIELPNYIELPAELTGIEARIFALIGKWFPTGSHKVGATFGCLVPKLVTGQFDPTKQIAVWPSTGNYCRGGAYNATLLACDSLAILPEEMSQERFDWLKTVAGEIITTPGGESNVKKIFDKCWELKHERGNEVEIFNQFDEFGNHLWHHEVTGPAMKEVLDKELGSSKFRGTCLTTGSAGTLGSADFLKKIYSTAKTVAGESLQCPTMLLNGYGYHRIEGIGDKHIPWIHNVKQTDFVIAIDDNDCINLMRLFNLDAGQKYLEKMGVPEKTISYLPLLGISSLANLLMTIKYAKYYELTRKDTIMTVFTDSMSMYNSRLQEYEEKFGKYKEIDAAVDHHRSLQGIKTDSMIELRYTEKQRIHHLKYFTWVEQQGKSVEELNQQWYNEENYWNAIYSIASKLEGLITEFNEQVALH